MTVSVVAQSRRNRSADKPNEDAYAVRLDIDGAVFVVADGVTRSRAPDGSYPQPSGASIAAQLVAQSLVSALAGATASALAQAFHLANQSLDQLNHSMHIWELLDYGAHDLWGAVATAALVRDGVVYWGHLGDTALLYLPRTGGLIVPTPDQVAGTAALLDHMPAADLAAAGGREPYARRHLRNHPELPRSYGVLTGEAAAERYVVTGQFAVQAGDRLVLCSDALKNLAGGGADAWPLLEPWLRGAVHPGALDDLFEAIEAAEVHGSVRSDDKTVILAELGD